MCVPMRCLYLIPWLRCADRLRLHILMIENFIAHVHVQNIALPISSADGIYGGVCLAVKGPDCVVFFDWEDGAFIRKIDVVPTAVYWNETGDSLVLVCADCFYVLRYDRDIVAAAVSAGNINPDEGVDGSFELVTTINERAHTGQWVGECFLYTNSAGSYVYFCAFCQCGLN